MTRHRPPSIRPAATAPGEPSDATPGGSLIVASLPQPGRDGQRSEVSVLFVSMKCEISRFGAKTAACKRGRRIARLPRRVCMPMAQSASLVAEFSPQWTADYADSPGFLESVNSCVRCPCDTLPGRSLPEGTSFANRGRAVVDPHFEPSAKDVATSSRRRMIHSQRINASR